MRLTFLVQVFFQGVTGVADVQQSCTCLSQQHATLSEL